MRRGSIAATAVVVLSLVAVACSNGGSSTGGAGSGGTTPTMATTSGSSGYGRSGGGYGGYGGGGSGGGNNGGGGGGASALTVTQSNYQFSPATVTVKSGDTITLTDSDPTTPHNFTVKGSSIDVTNQGGQSQNVTINLKPGTYSFFCQFHVSLGMKGTLVVT